MLGKKESERLLLDRREKGKKGKKEGGGKEGKERENGKLV